MRAYATSMRLALVVLTLLPRLLFAEEIPAGTRLVLRAEQAVGSRTSKTGDRLHLRVVAPAIYEDRIVVPADSFVEAEVVSAVRTRWVGGRAVLTLRASRIVLPDGRIRPLTSLTFHPYPVQAQRRPPRRPYLTVTGVTVGLMGISVMSYGSTNDRLVVGGMGAGVTTAALLGRGTEIEIREGMALEAHFDQGVPLD
jgi:hypothetical protein